MGKIKEGRESAYDVVELEANGVGGATEAEDEHLVDGVPYRRVYFLLLLQRP